MALDPPEATSGEAGVPAKDDDYLILSTIHSAKGQEWKAVHILNVVDGCIPSDMRTGTAEEVEEERRLLYVAMTRAKEVLPLHVPQRFYVHQQAEYGDRHVYAARTRFIPDALTTLFDCSVWPVAAGPLVVNTPHLKRTLLRRLRHALGQTDAKHGHLRPGYTPGRLAELFAPGFEMESHSTYSRFFSEAIDTALNWGIGRLGKNSSAKGMVVTGDDLARHRKTFRAYSLIYPLVWALSRLDALVPASGYMLIASLRRRTG